MRIGMLKTMVCNAQYIDGAPFYILKFDGVYGDPVKSKLVEFKNFIITFETTDDDCHIIKDSARVYDPDDLYKQYNSFAYAEAVENKLERAMKALRPKEVWVSNYYQLSSFVNNNFEEV